VEDVDTAVRLRLFADISPGRKSSARPIFLACQTGILNEGVVVFADALGFLTAGPALAFFVVLDQLLHAAVGIALGRCAALDDSLHDGRCV
jgi:hypothetical protein